MAAAGMTRPFMMGFSTKLTKNAISNLVRGGATATVAIVLPRFLTRSLDTQHFAAWSLILQIASYASYLDFGLQTAIARFVAQAVELEQRERQAKLISTALTLLSLAGLIAFTGISIIICLFPHLLFGVPSALLSEFQHAALLLALSACLLLPLSTYTGVLIGMHRNEIPALIIGSTRIAGAGAAIMAAHFTHSLTVLSLCIGVPNVLGGLLQMVAVHELVTEGRARMRRICRAIGAELLRFCSSLTVWSFGMLLISGLDVTIVGHFQFAAVGFYSIASILITFFAGLNTSVLSALMAPVAALHARDEGTRIRKIVFAATRVTMLVNLAITTIIFLWGRALLQLWVGPVYAGSALPILKVLAVAQTGRLMIAPYSVMLISVGEHSKGVPMAICEALINLMASILGIILLGPIGVAWGTLAGAICGLLWTFLRVIPSVAAVPINVASFLLEAVLPGSIPFLPIAIFLLLEGQLNSDMHRVGLVLCTAAIPVLGRWCFKRSQPDRELAKPASPQSVP